ncbi:hypothetical protein BCR33DRAFT_732804 [Rhizoclosmatium globosum]|uniref:Nitrogen permease regulator 3 n=1 Tax=Rhizoclosmatium globosum TaxID=329046 RepID=A0A1Y2D131_9FUNG|nr:hypothetical protein BCR33DRAFT_732804 [Rhizoclosmatium globosum]|eukprot:ORY52988.1 hypothetical protein BCR33DRAFT_732804 [Rhizoclosmatium globosum]
MSLCDRIFKLAVDDVVFVGHPTLLNADRPRTGHRFARQIQRKQRTEQSNTEQLVLHGDDQDDLGYNDEETIITPLTPSFEKSVTTPIISSRPLPQHQNPQNCSPAPALIPTPTMATHPSPLIGSSTATKSKPTISPQQQPHHQLSMFNLVFAVIPEDDQEGTDCEVHYVYNNILAKLTAALKYEQLKRGYLKKEIDIIMGIRDEFHNGADLEHSSLARMLADTFHAMTNPDIPSNALSVNHVHTHLDLNSSVDISILIDRTILGGTNHCYSGESDGMVGGMVGGGGDRDKDAEDDDGGALARFQATHPPLRPYQAVLLLYHAEEILKSLPADSAPLLHDLIEIVTPTQSLENLAFALSCSLAQVYRLVCHLVYWKKAKVIDVINLRNMYVVSREADLSRLSKLDNELTVRVKDLDLGKMLSVMSTPRAFSSIFKDKSVPYLEIIALFLRNNLIEQCRMKLLIIIPKQIWTLKPEFENYVLAQSVNELTQDSALIVRNPLYCNETEAQMIETIALTQPQPFPAIFQRFVPYMTGKVHSEEMMYRENMVRKDFKAFMRFVICFCHIIEEVNLGLL